jgi:Putative Actinobacterial Holin-X, holin superfamily III
MDSMVRSETPQPAGADQSLGDLVALAAKDVSQLIRYEIDLAKTEMKGDARRVGMAVAGIGLAAFVGCLVLVLVCFAFAYGLITLGIWDWAAFLIVAGTCVLLAGVAVGIALLKLSKLSGLSRTRKTVTEGLGMLRHEVQHPDGQRPELAARKTR